MVMKCFEKSVQTIVIIFYIHSNFPLGFGLGSQYLFCLLHIYEVMRTYPRQYVLLGNIRGNNEYSAVTFYLILPKFIVINLFNGIFLLHYVYISYILINSRSNFTDFRIVDYTASMCVWLSKS